MTKLIFKIQIYKTNLKTKPKRKSYDHSSSNKSHIKRAWCVLTSKENRNRLMNFVLVLFTIEQIAKNTTFAHDRVQTRKSDRALSDDVSPVCLIGGLLSVLCTAMKRGEIFMIGFEMSVFNRWCGILSS